MTNWETEMQNVNDFIEMLYINAISSLGLIVKDNKVLTVGMINKFLKTRGYQANFVSGKSIMVNGFVCVDVQEKYIEVWHDTGLNPKSYFIKDSFLTNLPITLNYFERI